MEFQLASGVKVADLTGIQQGYQVRETEKYFHFYINISRENLESILIDLFALVATPGFFVMEIPADQIDEEKLRQSNDDPYHKNVYYMDGLEQGQFQQLWSEGRDLLLDDGLVGFGFGSHPNLTQGQYDEVFVGKYKIVSIYTNVPSKFEIALNNLGIPKVEKLRTVWDNFTEESPGMAEIIRVNDTSIYDLMHKLKDLGLYFVEHREE